MYRHTFKCTYLYITTHQILITLDPTQRLFNSFKMLEDKIIHHLTFFFNYRFNKEVIFERELEKK